jgi:hypothetical protein
MHVLGVRSRRGWWVALVAACVLQVNWYTVFYPTPKDGETCAALAGNIEAATFIRTQYDNGVEEIRRRLEHEHVLFVAKFSLVGGIFAALLLLNRKESLLVGLDGARSSRSRHRSTARSIPPAADPGASEASSPTSVVRVPDETSSPLIEERRMSLACAFLWASVATAAIVDARIQFNVAFIRALGSWVSKIECVLLGTVASYGWEHHLKSQGVLSSRFYAFRVSRRCLQGSTPRVLPSRSCDDSD